MHDHAFAEFDTSKKCSSVTTSIILWPYKLKPITMLVKLTNIKSNNSKNATRKFDLPEWQEVNQ